MVITNGLFSNPINWFVYFRWFICRPFLTKLDDGDDLYKQEKFTEALEFYEDALMDVLLIKNELPEENI